VGFPRTKNVGGAYKKVAGCFDGKADKFGAFQILVYPAGRFEVVADHSADLDALLVVNPPGSHG